MNENLKRPEKTTVTRNVDEFIKDTNNIYESVVIMAKRSNQISEKVKEELKEELEQFTTHVDSLEEVYENREQIELVKMYEKLPKPTLLAIHEFLKKEIYFRTPEKE